MKKQRTSAQPRLSVLALAVQAAFAVPAWSLPTGATIVNGAVSLSAPAANTLQVNAGNGAIINWQGFSIGAGEVTRFVQPSATSAVLNRVTGNQASALLGQLQGNGRVFLINRNGIAVGSGARIDTNSFIASTLDIADADFLSGRLRFFASAGAGGIQNDGVITAGPGGKIALIAPNIVNSGIIHAPDGNILLAAGRSIEITSSDLDGVRFEVQAPTDSVLNLGKLLAENGAVRAFAATLRSSGEIRAERLTQGADGTIVLAGSGDVTLAAGSITSASGVSGGNVTVQSYGGTTRVAGVVGANGANGAGGQVSVLGARVGIEDHALIDASGATGGGQVLVGGDFQGGNAQVQNAQRVNVAEGATLRADATAQGDGGRVIVWADENTRFAGALSAQGGAAGGNGGFAEVSGKANLEFTGTANLQAPHGAMGTLLLDPLDIVVANGSGILPTVVDEFADFADNVVTIDPTKLAAIGANVALQASRDVYVKDRIALTTAGAGISIDAGGPAHTGGSIYLEDLVSRPGGISTNGGAVTLRAASIEQMAGISTNGGAVDIETTGALTYAGAIRTTGGSVRLASSGSGVAWSDVDAGSGEITVSAQNSVNYGTYTTTGTLNVTSAAGGVSGNGLVAGV
ncbi:MAG TPA: filamentous hemagglutinin N-terminal domain-containing protein, partial [Ramlibacter sp.]|nr:filamentous hemagglutinin N-terminal domain-containing protein [Ramlibacter sp.]